MAWSQARAHRPADRVNPVSGVETLFAPVHAGYGYLSTSEAEAAQLMTFGCQDVDLVRYAAEACRIADASTVSIDRAREFATQAYSGVFKQKLQEKAFEYLALTKADRTPARPALDRPSCISATSDAERLNNTVEYPPSAILWRYEDVRTQNPDFGPDYLNPRQKQNLARGFRARAISDSLDADKMIQAVMLYDSLKAAEPTYCPGANSTNKMWCASIREQLSRVRFSYPALFDAPDRTAAEDTRLDGIRQKVYTVLGTRGRPLVTAEKARGEELGRYFDSAPPDSYPAAADFVPSAESDAARGAREERERDRNGRGRSAYRELVRANDTDPDALNRLWTRYEEARSEGFTVCNRDALDPDGILSETNYNKKRKECLAKAARMAPLNRAAEAQLQATATSYSDSLNGRARAMCDLSTEDLVKSYPQVTRQLLLDESGADRALSKSVLCQTGLSARFNNAAKQSCTGVTGNLTSGARVKRLKANWPFGTGIDYTVTREADGTLRVDLKINFTRGVGVTNAQVTTARDAWLTQANTYFNQQAGAVTPPLDPRVRINIAQGTGAHAKEIKIHKCFNADLIRAGRATSCTAAGNRENATNWTLGADNSTANHEFGHALGLDDEYEDTGYPFNLLGEHDSIMNNSNDPAARFYRRHFEQMVDPAVRCTAGTAAAAPAGGTR